MIPYSSSNIMDSIRASADLIIEAADGNVYFGFCKPGTLSISEAGWSIMRIKQDTDANYNTGLGGNVTEYTWANGQCSFNLVLTLATTYSYFFKKF